MASSTASPVTRRGSRTAGAPEVLAALTVVCQIGYPLTGGPVRNALTIATVLLWCAAGVTHAAVSRGVRFAGQVVAVTAGIGFAAEAAGVATGLPFGHYSYASTLGPRLAGVPIVIPLAWTMMAYPALLVGRRLGSPVLLGTLALASWDLFLDPQMVSAGHWHFTGSGPRLNDIPLTNTLGWIAIAAVVMLALSRLPGSRRDADDRLMYALYLWTYASSVLAAAAFFHRPGVAAVGGVVMGVPAFLLARELHRSREAGRA